MNPYQKIFKALNQARVKYLIVGGVAVNLHGYSRFTGDIDILLALDQENLNRMEKIAERLDYTARLPVELHELNDEKKLKNWMKKKGLKAYTFVSNKQPQLDIDIIVDESLQFQKHFQKRKKVKIWDMTVSVVSLDDLINMKRKAKREQDSIRPQKSSKTKGFMKKKRFDPQLDYLKRCKKSSPESKLNWLAAALEFGKMKKKTVK